MNGRSLQFALGVSYTWVSRRLNGKVSMSAEDMEMIEDVTGISPVFLISGVNPENRHPDNPNGGSGYSVHPPGLEPGTHCLRVSAEKPQVDGADVIEFQPRRDSGTTTDGAAEVIEFPRRSDNYRGEALR